MESLPEECAVHALGFLELEDVIDFTRTTKDASALVTKHDTDLVRAIRAATSSGEDIVQAHHLPTPTPTPNPSPNPTITITLTLTRARARARART